MMKRREDEKILDVNASMQGTMVFAEPVNLRISGKFQGSLNTKGTLLIGENADVNADVVGESIFIAGKVVGKIKATKLITMHPTADVYADIETPRLVMEEGAVFNGKCKMLHGKLSLGELSEYLAIEQNKIMEWVNAGRIPVQKEGDKLLFDSKEVETWINQKQ